MEIEEQKLKVFEKKIEMKATQLNWERTEEYPYLLFFKGLRPDFKRAGNKSRQT